MNTKEQIKSETKIISLQIKNFFKKNESLISGIQPEELKIESAFLSKNIINQIFYSQKEIYFNAEFSKFKTGIKQQLQKSGIKPVEYIVEYLKNTPTAQLPDVKFSHAENVLGYERAIEEYRVIIAAEKSI